MKISGLFSLPEDEISIFRKKYDFMEEFELDFLCK